MKEEKLINIGVIIKPHGIRGEVKTEILEDYHSDFERLADVILVNPKDNEEYLVGIEKSRIHKKAYLVKFEGIDDPEQAEFYRNWLLKAPASVLAPLEEDEFYVNDLIGVSVYLPSGVCIGKVTGVFKAGYNDVYEIKCPQTGRVNMIPARKKFIETIDIQEGKLIIKPIEGLIEY